MTPDAGLADEFELQRERLIAVAFRMLGSRTDAEDAVQEAWLRLARQEPGTIDNLSGWLTTVVGRICIDALRSRKTKPEVPSGDDLPEFVVTVDDDAPDERAVLADSVGLALLVVLDSLSPDERLAFVLHDMFAVPFAEIGGILGKTTDASKMLASRARRKVQGSPLPSDGRQRQREVVDAFLAASREGNFEALLKVLDPDVVWRTYTPRGMSVRVGSDEVGAAAEKGGRAAAVAARVLINGEPGIIAWSTKGRPLSVMACTVVDGRIVEVVALLDPARLATMDLPTPPTA